MAEDHDQPSQSLTQCVDPIPAPS